MRSAAGKTMLAGVVVAAVFTYVASMRTTILQYKQERGLSLAGDSRYAGDAQACLMYAPQKPDTVYFAGCGGFF